MRSVLQNGLLRAGLVAACLGVVGCGEPAEDEAAGDPRLVITADWLAGTLTLLDHDALVGGASAEAATVDTIDLSAYAPGPLELELTPDGKRAVVTISPGFFGGGVGGSLVGSPEVPEGGTLLVVDIAAREVVAELETEHTPMGIAISPDGRTAWTANYGDAETGKTLSKIDLGSYTVVSDTEVGGRPEQVTLNADGTQGALNLASDNAFRLFDTGSGAVSDPIETASDPSDLAFVPGTGRIAVAASQGLRVQIFEVESGAMVAEIPTSGAFPYGVTHIPGTTRVLVTGGIADANLYDIDVATGELLGKTVLLGGSYPLVAAINAEASHAFVPHPVDGMFSVFDIATGDLHTIALGDGGGPTYAAVQPAQ
jgi:DNA-binding beta-propeller fold protein YncE